MKPLFTVLFNDGARVEFFRDSYRFFPSVADGVKLFNLYYNGEISWSAFGIVAGVMKREAYAAALAILVAVQDRGSPLPVPASPPFPGPS